MSEHGTPYLENRLGAVVLTVAYTLIAVTIVLAIARFYVSLRWKYKVGFDGLAFLLANVGHSTCSTSDNERLGYLVLFILKKLKN